MTSRLAPVVGITLLAAAASFAGRATAVPCTPVRIAPTDATLPLDFRRAMSELMEATSMEGQAWNCTGGVLGVSVDPSGSFATLTLTDASGRRVERRIPRALDLVPSAKALLAAPIAPLRVDPGATDFADAMHLFERGDYPSAAKRLSDFSKAHPDDGRGEDAAFLGILSLQRTGKTAEAAAAAQRYLQAYPKGYRRAEAVKIASQR